MRAAYERVLRTSSEKTDSDEDVVTTFIIKSDSVPALWAGGGGAFQWWGGAPGRQTGAGFMINFLMNAVTNVVLRSGPVAQRWELSLARAVFLHRLGEIRDRKPENQSYRASGLTLLTATDALLRVKLLSGYC